MNITQPLDTYIYSTNSEMKKKGSDNNINITTKNSIAGVALISFIVRRRRRILPLISIISCCLFLFIFVAFCFLAPSPNDFDDHHLSLLRHPYHFSTANNGGIVLQYNSDRKAEFLVPADGGCLGRDLWSTPQSEFYVSCSNASRNFTMADMKTDPNRYLLIATSGGLNQQRTGITDAVVAAYILNATLVVPMLDQKSYWKDSSDFGDIFDEYHFMNSLSKDVKIIKQLPTEEVKATPPYSMRVPRKCTPQCYQDRVLPVFKKRHVVQLSKFDYRLSNKLDKHLQKLRCRVNYHALRFTDSIIEMGKNLVERMRTKSKHFIALHLRFEPDMLAFSGCYYGGGEKEREELGAIRKRWKTLHASNPDKMLRNGRCPLSPGEVGLMLRALGFGSDAHLYVASGEIYGGEETLAPLKTLFPNFYSKETIASKEELAPFSSFSSRMASLDFIVSDESDVFVANNNGNMARMLAGRRRYFGHKPTIRPNAKKLYKLFMNRNNMTWEEFCSKVRTHQIGFMGEPNEIKPDVGVFYENPASCICKAAGPKVIELISLQNQVHKDNKEDDTNKEHDYVTEEEMTDDEQDWFEMDYLKNGNGFDQGKEKLDGTSADPGLLTKPEHIEML